MPELRQAGDVVDLDYPPFIVDRAEDAVPPRPPPTFTCAKIRLRPR
jgi:hypothetical protein